MPSVTSQYSEGSRELRSASPTILEKSAAASKYMTTAYQNVPRSAAAYGSDASSRHSLDRLSASRDSLMGASTPPPPPLPKRGEGLIAAEGRFDGHFTSYLKQQQQQNYEESKLSRLGSPLRDNFVDRAGGGSSGLPDTARGPPAPTPAALSPSSVPLDLSKKKTASSFRLAPSIASPLPADIFAKEISLADACSLCTTALGLISGCKCLGQFLHHLRMADL